MSADSYGCHLVCALEALDPRVQERRPHPDQNKFPFKRGKLSCRMCDSNLGNIQNNVRASLQASAFQVQRDCAVIKFAGVSFAATPTLLIPHIKGSLLGKAVGFVMPDKGSKGGGGECKDGRGKIGGAQSASRSITLKAVLLAAGKTDELQCLRQVEAQLSSPPATPSPLQQDDNSGEIGTSGSSGGSIDHLVIEETLAKLVLYVTANDGVISTGTGKALLENFFFEAGNDGPRFKAAIESAGIKWHLDQWPDSPLCYEESGVNPGPHRIRLVGVENEPAGSSSKHATMPSANHPPAAPSTLRTAQSRPPSLNSLGLPLRPEKKECAFFMKHRSFKYGLDRVYHHPEPDSAKLYNHPELEQDSAKFVGVVAKTAVDKNGNDIAYVQLFTKTGDELSDKKRREAFLFLGPPPKDGFKRGRATVMSAGLPLIRGDELADLVLHDGKRGLQISGGCLSAVASSGRGEDGFRRYLEGLLAALHGEASDRETALHGLSHERACRSAWSGLAMCGSLTNLIVRVLEALVQTSAESRSSRLFARAALNSIVLSSITLPQSTTVYELVSSPDQRELVSSPDKRELRGQLVCVLLDVWRVAPLAQRRIHFLLTTFFRKHSSQAPQLLDLEKMLGLLSTNLPGGDLLSCYHWRDQPLKLLASESSGELGSGAILHPVLARGGAYDDFDSYME
ncbi:MAG: hypothetical protein SGPRY_004256 [Prymnesium sp.]